MPAIHSPPKVQAQLDGFSFGVTFAFSINFAMGAGFLSLPWAFNQSGVILGALMMMVIAIPLAISVPYNLEAMARADAVYRLRRKNDSFINEHDPLIHNDPTDPNALMSDGNLIVRRDKFELYELCELFVGNVAKILFIVCLTAYTYGCLWAFSSVFAEAMAHTLPLFTSSNSSYFFYIALFAAIVIPFTCMELNEQVYTQVFLACCRLLVIVAMVSSALVAYLTHDQILDHTTPSPMFDLSGILEILPIAAYAFAFTQSIPALSEPVADKTQLASIFRFTVLACLVGYTTIGVSVALAFGSSVEPSCNLNWLAYSGGRALGEPVAYLAQAIRLYVVIFPALDVASAFPLMAITLGNNLFSCAYGHAAKKMVSGVLIVYCIVSGLAVLSVNCIVCQNIFHSSVFVSPLPPASSSDLTSSLFFFILSQLHM
jgi:amino acid permease